MSDIFGREIEDYKHLRALKELGYDVNRYLTDRANSMRQPPHNFSIAKGGNDVLRQETSAQVVGYATNSLQAIQSMVEEILYTEHRLPDLIPMDMSVPETAASYSYRVLDRAGNARFIDHSGSNANLSYVGVRNVPYQLHLSGVVARWNSEDMRLAMGGMIDLPAETIMGAMRTMMDHMNEVGIEGDSTHSDTETGLINLSAATNPNSSQVRIVTTDTTLANMTREAAITFISAQVGDMIESTQEVIGTQIRQGMTVYLPVAQYNYITTEGYNVEQNMNMWSYLQTGNPFTYRTGSPLMIKSVIELKNNGSVISGSATDRMVIAVNDSMVWEMGVAFMPRVRMPIEMHFGVDVPIEAKFSPLNLKLPECVRYVDGV